MNRSHFAYYIFQYQEPPYNEREFPRDSQLIVNYPEHIQSFFKLLTSCFDIIRGFAEKIPGFQEMVSHDQELLFLSGSLELFVLHIASR